MLLLLETWGTNVDNIVVVDVDEINVVDCVLSIDCEDDCVVSGDDVDDIALFDGPTEIITVEPFGEKNLLQFF